MPALTSWAARGPGDGVTVPAGGWRLAAFFGLTFATSWALGAAGAWADPPALGVALRLLAGFGPSLAAVGMVGASSGGPGLRAALARWLRWRVGWRWLALAFALPPVLMTVAVAAHVALGGADPITVEARQIPLVIGNFGLVFLIGGPLGEELGWRGYATPALRARMGWRSASLIVGLVWGAWHLPLFLLTDGPQAQMSLPIFLINILAGAVVFGWLSERAGGSVVPALVLHTSLNGWAGVLGIVPTAETGRPYALVTLLLVVVAVGLISPRAATPTPGRPRHRRPPRATTRLRPG